MRETAATIPLLPRRLVHGTPLGDMRSARRGSGGDLVGLREYRRGDDLRRLDHRASARASWARADDVLLVREFYADVAAAVVLVLDRRASMRLFPADLPWLRKPEAVREIVRLLVDSAFDAGSSIGCLELGADCAPDWWPPLRRPRPAEWEDDEAEPAPSGSLALALDALVRVPRPGKGTFVFVVSDFLEPPGEEAWWRLLARGFDLIPVVVQDPVWEASFPDVAGAPLPVARADRSRPRLVRVTRRDAARLRDAHEGRLRALLDRLRGLTLEPIWIAEEDPASVHLAFGRWAAARAGGLR